MMKYLKRIYNAVGLGRNQDSPYMQLQHLINSSKQCKEPIESILNQAHLLCKTNLSAEQTRYAQIILDKAKQLSSLMHGTLDCATLHSGNEIILTQQDFSILEMVSHIKSIVKPLVMEKRIRFTVDVDPMLRDSYVGDEERIEQILINMILNAITATEAGKISLKIVCYQQMDQADTLLFLVSDTGPGIAADHIPTLFDLNTRQQQDPTIGLGLAKGKALINKMQGQIGVYSLPEKGSTFWFTVKLSKTVRNPIEESSIAFDMPLTSYDILIVEDNIVNQKTLYHLLQHQHHECDIAKNGVEALEKISQKKYDVVLMDLHMPEMDGFVATTKILEAHKKDVPIIIALSADNSPQDYAKCIQYGMHTLLGKPIPQKKLLQIIQSVTKK